MEVIYDDKTQIEIDQARQQLDNFIEVYAKKASKLPLPQRMDAAEEMMGHPIYIHMTDRLIQLHQNAILKAVVFKRN